MFLFILMFLFLDHLSLILTFQLVFILTDFPFLTIPFFYLIRSKLLLFALFEFFLLFHFAIPLLLIIFITITILITIPLLIPIFVSLPVVIIILIAASFIPPAIASVIIATVITAFVITAFAITTFAITAFVAATIITTIFVFILLSIFLPIECHLIFLFFPLIDFLGDFNPFCLKN